AHPRIVGIERHGAPQQAFPFSRIAAEESRQLDEHLSFRGQSRRIVWGEHQGGVDLLLRTAELPERRPQPLTPTVHLQALPTLQKTAKCATAPWGFTLTASSAWARPRAGPAQRSALES